MVQVLLYRSLKTVKNKINNTNSIAVFFGILGDKTKFNRVHYHTFAYLIYGIVQVSIPYANHFYTLTAMCTLLGVMDGTLLAFIVPITCDLVSPKLANQAAGYYHVVMSPMAIGRTRFFQICRISFLNVTFLNFLL